MGNDRARQLTLTSDFDTYTYKHACILHTHVHIHTHMHHVDRDRKMGKEEKREENKVQMTHVDKTLKTQSDY